MSEPVAVFTDPKNVGIGHAWIGARELGPDLIVWPADSKKPEMYDRDEYYFEVRVYRRD